MTIDVACERYYEEVGQHHKRPEATQWSLDWIVSYFGGSKPISEIYDDDVAKMVAKRRGERVHNLARDGERPGKDGKLVSPARVNRSVTEPLRKVLRRAANLWRQTVQPIRWSDHMLKEPKELVRELTADQERRLFDILALDHHAVVRVALRTGLRESEVALLTWDQVDWGELQLNFTGKGGLKLTVPISPAVRDILWAQQGKDAVYVFTNTRGGPLTVPALVSAVKRAFKKLGIKFRFHDLRHTAATRLLRTSGNLKMVQRMLNHADIQTTVKYAHVMVEDLRGKLLEMDAVEAAKSPTNYPTGMENDTDLEETKELKSIDKTSNRGSK